MNWDLRLDRSRSYSLELEKSRVQLGSQNRVQPFCQIIDITIIRGDRKDRFLCFFFADHLATRNIASSLIRRMEVANIPAQAFWQVNKICVHPKPAKTALERGGSTCTYACSYQYLRQSDKSILQESTCLMIASNLCSLPHIAGWPSGSASGQVPIRHSALQPADVGCINNMANQPYLVPEGCWLQDLSDSLG